MRLRSMLTAVALALVPGALFAGGGGTGASFMSLDSGADAIAMGGAVASRGGSVASVFWNPGGLGWLRGTGFTVAHSEHVQSIRYENLGAARGTDQLAFGLSVRGLFAGGLEERTTPSEAPLSQFGVTSVAPAITCARSFGRRYAVGTSLKLVYQKMGGDRASSFAGDIGVSAVSGIRGLRAGAALTNWGSGVKFTDRSYPLPTRLRAGLSYSLPGRGILVAGDAVKPFHQPLFACLGAEAVIRERISLRAGYKGGLSDAGGVAGLAAGLGVKIRGFDVDYAFASHGTLGLAHHFSLSFAAGREAAPGGRNERIIAAELQRRARITAETFYHQGLAQLRTDKLEEALGSFDLALVWDPAYGDAARANAETRGKIDEREAGRHLASGLAHFQKGELIDAISEFGRVLDIKPDHQAAREWLTKASDALLTARPSGDTLRGGPAGLIDRHMRAGLALLSAKKYRQAIGEWEQVLALDPRHAAAVTSIARARSLLQQAVDEALQRADRSAAQGKWPAALVQVNLVLALDPESDAALAKQQEISAALQELSGTHARNGIGLYDQGKYGQAEVELKLALALAKDNKAAAEYLAKLGSQLVKARGEDLNDLYLKGISAYTREDFEQAIVYWQRVVEIDPGHANAKRNIERAQAKLRITGR